MCLTYFVVFSLENGYFQFVADYEYVYKRTLTVSIKNAPIIVPTSISMVNGDWVKDGYINGKDFSKFLHAQQGADTEQDHHQGERQAQLGLRPAGELGADGGGQHAPCVHKSGEQQDDDAHNGVDPAVELLHREYLHM